MIDPLQLSDLRDLSAEHLPDLWWRRKVTPSPGPETAGPGLWRTGPKGDFRRAMIEAIDHASDVVLVASFLLTDANLAEGMLRAAARGVRVYVLTASEHRVMKAPEADDSVDKYTVDEHKQLLRKLAGKTLLRSAEHFHAKFVVVDPPWLKRGPSRAFLSTANFNRALTDGVELGLELDAARSGVLAGVFAHAFWTEAERELVEVDRLATVAPPPAVPTFAAHPGVVTTTRTSTGLRDAVLGLISGARKRLLVSSYGLDVAHPSVLAIREAAMRGVDVTVLTRPRPAVKAAVRSLVEVGVVVRAHDKLHAKAILADDLGLVMTANLEPHGLDAGFEVGARVAPTTHLIGVLSEWSDAFPWEFRAEPVRSDTLGEIWLANRHSREPKAQVVEIEAVRLPPVTAPDALSLAAAPKPELKAPPAGDRLPCRIRFEWEVRAPLLPKGARERLRVVKRTNTDKDGKAVTIDERVPYDPPVYEHQGNLYVKLKSAAEAEAARRLADEVRGVVVL